MLNYINNNFIKLLALKAFIINKVEKQPAIGVLTKRYSENMQ